MRRISLLVLSLVFALAAVPVFAQQPGPGEIIKNPGRVEYDPSVDHAQLTKYVLGFFLVGATSPVQTADLPVVAPGPDGKVLQAMPFASLGFGRYYVQIKPVAGPIEGEWSTPSNEGVRGPLPASGLAVKK
jgi:hypothetical protein